MPDASGASKQMSNEDLRAVIADAERDSLAYMGSKLSKQRKDALKYYEAEQFDPSTGLAAVPGRSSVVMQEVADVVDWIMPDLLKKFASSENSVEFEATDESADASSKQATAYVNYVFHQDNPGFMILHSFFQDALVQKNGIVKVWWDDQATDEVRTLQDLPNDAYALLLEDPDVEIIAHTENAAAGPESGVTPVDGGEAGVGGSAPAEPTHDVRYKVKPGKCCVEPVPPEEFLMARDAKRIPTTPYCAHRTRRSISDLIAEGYDPDQCKTLPSDDDETFDDEALERRDGDDDSGDVVDRKGVLRQVWLSDAYVLVDYDGDGIAERRRVITAGSQGTILRRKDPENEGKYIDCNDLWEGPPPFASITPKPKSHRFYGRSIADITMDLQRIFSVLTRQMLDNLYAQNNPRNVVDEFVNIDDYMSPRLGSYVRLSEGAGGAAGHVEPIIVPFVAEKVIPVLEWFEGVKENRTGVTKYNQGTDADSLNKTARGITQIMSAAQQRIELIARIFAETGVSEMFMLILQCVSKYQKKSRVVKVAGKYTAIDPRGWESMFRMKINVGLGTGNKDQQLVHLQTIASIQKELVMGGKTNIVSDENVYHTCRQITENAGLRNPELYFTDPGKAPPPQPQPNPQMVKVEQDGQAKQAELAIKAKEVSGKLALADRKQQGEMALKAHAQVADHAMAAKGQQMDNSLQRDNAQADRQSQSGDVSKAIEQVGQMLNDFMQSQKARDTKQDLVIQALASKLGFSTDNAAAMQ